MSQSRVSSTTHSAAAAAPEVRSIFNAARKIRAHKKSFVRILLRMLSVGGGWW